MKKEKPSRSQDLFRPTGDREETAGTTGTSLTEAWVAGGRNIVLSHVRVAALLQLSTADHEGGPSGSLRARQRLIPTTGPSPQQAGCI